MFPGDRKLNEDLLERAIRELSLDGRFRFLEKQLYYKVNRLNKNRLREFFTRSPRARAPSIGWSAFQEVLRKYESAQGEIPGLIRGLSLERVQGRGEVDLTRYAFDYLLFTERDEIAEFFYRNDFPFTAKTAVLSLNGYPGGMRDVFLDALRSFEDIEILLLADASPAGFRFRKRLEKRTGAFSPGRVVRRLGLRPGDFHHLPGLFFTSPGLDARELDAARRCPVSPAREKEWLEAGNVLETENLSPARLLNLASRALRRFTRGKSKIMAGC